LLLNSIFKYLFIFFSAIALGYSNGFTGLYLSDDGAQLLSGHASSAAFAVGVQADHVDGLPGPLDDDGAQLRESLVTLKVKPECYQTTQ
jgi:hypothetical protein